MFLIILNVIFIFPFAKTNYYPWYEQISRQETVAKNCENSPVRTNGYDTKQFDHILVDHKHKFLYCYVPKIACTNWKRVLMVLTDRSNSTNLTEIPASVAHENSSVTRLSDLSATEAKNCLDNYITFLMVRHPFERLLSAYRNKLEDNLPSAKYFQARIGTHIVKTYRKNPTPNQLQYGDDVSFAEFVRFLISEGIDNEHWTPIDRLCYPCTINYTFVGKYENLDEDAAAILEMIGAPSVDFPRNKPSRTSEKLKSYFREISLGQIEQLYRIYEPDFRLFGYDLEQLLGFNFG